MKFVIITQARLNSSRLPEKVLKNINGKALLQIHLERVRKNTTSTKMVDSISVKEEVLLNPSKW